ncbi:PREDICTED: transmembrane protein 208-like [Amphimedon queenslandica]|uniref:Transmembrane protein 208 n=1 Tax=Amphimedon queenslandica TaxID=400682 RepID=A0A1X7VD27_AMPQE|nr:PREDICTED: transmembrane protein 208-like [Amphimedon queenslandica]|eukprot:XP_019849483.1 PREDICTED: transmembrane protein 208-like [Amphimedon queenslandica]
MPKERRKSQKEIYQGNQSTLSFYLYISIIATGIQFSYVVILTLWSGTISWLSLFWLLFAIANHGCGQKMLRYISRAEFGEKNELVDAGSDLEDSWISEYSKDVILFVSIIQILTIISNYVWLLWLIIPGFAFYKLWIFIIWPWFTAGSEPIGESKKSKKMKAKMTKIR